MVVIFSDDFEDGTLNAWTGTDLTPGETCVNTNLNPAHGLRNLRGTTDGDTANDYADAYKIFGSTYTEVYGRCYAYMSALPTTNYRRSIPMVFLSSGGNIRMFCCAELDPLHAGGAAVVWVVTYQDSALNFQNIFSASYTVSASQYYCIEVYEKIDAVNGVVKLWVDGVLTDINSSGLDTNASAIGGMAVGENRDDQPYAHYVDIDDVIMSDVYNGPIGTPYEGTVLTCLWKP